jgi:ferredoxin
MGSKGLRVASSESASSRTLADSHTRPPADLYDLLAEALAEPPAWLALAGSEWPLTAVARELAGGSAAVAAAVAALAVVPAESPAARRRRYLALSTGTGRPRFWFYESAHREGRLLGESAEAVARLYRAAGLRAAGAEMPDHASLELAFLAHLARLQAEASPEDVAWRRLERRFIEKHAGRWLPALGQALHASGDPVYGPIGQLVAAWLEERARPAGRKLKPAQAGRLPEMAQPDGCTLCGFCLGVCPRRALTIQETSQETVLLFLDARCHGCAKCVAVCPERALKMVASSPSVGAAGPVWRPWRRSPRARCPGCDEATVSCAELDFVSRQLGRPGWLAFCPSCRPYVMEID